MFISAFKSIFMESKTRYLKVLDQKMVEYTCTGMHNCLGGQCQSVHVSRPNSQHLPAMDGLDTAEKHRLFDHQSTL